MFDFQGFLIIGQNYLDRMKPNKIARIFEEKSRELSGTLLRKTSNFFSIR